MCVTTIGTRAFFNCPLTYGITFNGTTAEWNAIANYPEVLSFIPSGKTVTCMDGIVTT